MSKLLEKVQTYIGTGGASTLVTEYRLSYAPIAQGNHWDRRRLTSIQQCDGSVPTPKCLRATTFTWQGSEGKPSVTVTDNTINQGEGSAVGDMTAADFNGDGLTDVSLSDPQPNSDPLICKPTYFGQATPPNPDQPFVAVTMGAQYTQYYYDPNQDPQPGWKSYNQNKPCFGSLISGAKYVDYNGDGYTDVLLLQTPGGGPAKLYVLENNKSNSLISKSVLDGFAFGSGVNAIGDFNGDSRVDVFGRRNSGGTDFYQPYISNGDGTFTASGDSFVFSGSFLPADYNGDGCTDVLHYDATPTITFSALCNPGSPNTIDVDDVANTAVTVGDFNGDGKDDILTAKPSGAGKLFLSTGAGLKDSGFSVASNWYYHSIETGDFNGDGKTDLALIADGIGNHFPATGAHTIWFSTGAGFVLAYTVAGVSSDTVARGIVADWNSDGASDLWLKRASGDKIYRFNYVPDLVKSVDNGLGVATTVTYDRLNRGVVYTKDAQGAWPIRQINGPLYVVERIDAGNAVGGNYVSSYAYVGAEADLKGRGFVGFRRMSVTDEQTGVVQTTTYRQDYPFIGLVSLQTKIRQGTTLNSVENFYAADNLGGTRRFVRMTQSVYSSSDLDGSPMPTVTTDYNTYDPYGNPTKITVTTRINSVVKGTKVTDSEYDNDIANWFLGRLTRTTVTSTVVNSAVPPPLDSRLLLRLRKFKWTAEAGVHRARSYPVQAANRLHTRPVWQQENYNHNRNRHPTAHNNSKLRREGPFRNQYDKCGAAGRRVGVPRRVWDAKKAHRSKRPNNRMGA